MQFREIGRLCRKTLSHYTQQVFWPVPSNAPYSGKRNTIAACAFTFFFGGEFYFSSFFTTRSLLTGNWSGWICCSHFPFLLLPRQQQQDFHCLFNDDRPLYFCRNTFVFWCALILILFCYCSLWGYRLAATALLSLILLATTNVVRSIGIIDQTSDEPTTAPSILMPVSPAAPDVHFANTSSVPLPLTNKQIRWAVNLAVSRTAGKTSRKFFFFPSNWKAIVSVEQ